MIVLSVLQVFNALHLNCIELQKRGDCMDEVCSPRLATKAREKSVRHSHISAETCRQGVDFGDDPLHVYGRWNVVMAKS